MKFMEACQAFHDHQMTVKVLWNYLAHNVNTNLVGGTKLWLGLFRQTVNLCGGA